jgi:Lrp/AsnC family transcriptional regulator, regulator for asnA, asnC and gidA
MHEKMNKKAYAPDETDKKILNILLWNSRTTNREMGVKLGIAVGTVNTRIKRMEKEGIIKRYSIYVDYEKMGYIIEVMIQIKIKKGRFFELSKKLKSDPSVFTIFDITGDYDAEILARFHNKRQFDSYIKALQQDPDVEWTSTRLILNIIREKEIS